MPEETINASGRSPVLVNVGCGSIHHPAWINFDYAPSSTEVRRCDLRRGIPLGTGEADAVYHSHVLEHLTVEEGKAFLRECRRVLRSGGILRVAVPDLERLARAYVGALDDPTGPDMHLLDWLRLEMVDQFGREKTGGRVSDVIRELDQAGLAKVRQRIGLELDHLLADLQMPRRRLWARVRAAGWRGLLARGRRILVRSGVWLVGGRSMATALDIGLFRCSGEVHRVAYDQIALRAMLVQAGFVDMRVRRPDESRIPGFPSFGLEMLGGCVRKPDSLFMEAVRPA